MTMKMLPLIPLLLAVGCATLGPSADQIKEMANTSSSMCVTVAPGLYSPAAEVHYASFGGKSTGTGGGDGSATCGKSTVNFNNEGRAQPAPRPVLMPGLAAPKANP